MSKLYSTEKPCVDLNKQEGKSDKLVTKFYVLIGLNSFNLKQLCRKYEMCSDKISVVLQYIALAYYNSEKTH